MAFPPSGEKLLDLSPYEYPNATVRTIVRIPGHEMLTMRTSDTLEKLSQFYQKFGKPVIRIEESMEKWLVFRPSSSPPIVISIETDEERPDQLKITVLRSPFWNLRLDDTPNTN